MSDLLLCFPAAAAGGVHWQTLISKYNERHSTDLDIAALGHSSPLSAATALLWDVLRLVDAANAGNPVLAIEDGVAMTAKPGASATWPSLYQSLCEIINTNGSMTENEAGDTTTLAVLVSQLKPLLQRKWHCDFDESSLSYFDEHGKAKTIKKMKHLLQALLHWREQRLSCPSAGQHTELDETLKFRLELVPSKKRNDLLLRCVHPTATTMPLARSPSLVGCKGIEQEPIAPAQCPLVAGSDGSAASEGMPVDLVHEISMLRAENESLRNKNSALGQQNADELLLNKVAGDLKLDMDMWDNPSEPPPFEYRGSVASTPGSTALPSGVVSGDSTPLYSASGSQSCSLAGTPATWVWDGQHGQLCPMVPMFYMVGDRGLHGVPSGVVQQTLHIFEGQKILPSFFTMGAREY